METTTFTFRLPSDLKRQLEQLALEDDRSLANYIVRLLTAHVRQSTAHEKLVNPANY